MKALKAIGITMAARFLLGQFLQLVLNMSIVPQARVFFLRCCGASIGRGSIVHSIKFINFYRGSFRNFSIGNECFIGSDTLIDLASTVKLCDQVTLGPRVNIMTHINVGYSDHPMQIFFPSKTEGVEIGEGCFVGVGSTLLAGTKIGAKSFLAAGSVASREIPSGVLAGGVPACVIRSLDNHRS